MQVRDVIYFLVLSPQTLHWPRFEWCSKQIQQVGVISVECAVWLNGVSSSTTEPSTRQSGPPLAWTLLDTQLSMGWGLLRRWGSWGTVRVPGVNIVVRIEEPVRSSDSSANKDCSTNGLFWGHCFDVFAEGDILCEPRVRFYSSLLLECRLLLRVDCYNRSGLWDVKVFPIACGTGFLCRGMSLNAKP